MRLINFAEFRPAKGIIYSRVHLMRLVAQNKFPAPFRSAISASPGIDIQLVQERDGKGRLPASHVFSTPEIETLGALRPTLEGRTERQQNPHRPRSLAWAAWCIARLGGWNCYYKPPGPITFRRGMEQFYAIHRGRKLECDCNEK